MRRPILGLFLPEPEKSKTGDWFINTETGEQYVFDNGQWNELPQSTPEPPGPEIPTPADGDAGKVLKVGEDLSYELGEGGGSGGGIPFVNQIIDDDTSEVLRYETNSDFDTVFEHYESAISATSVYDGEDLSYGITDYTSASILRISTTDFNTFYEAEENPYYFTDDNHSAYSGNLICSIDTSDPLYRPQKAIGRGSNNTFITIHISSSD